MIVCTIVKIVNKYNIIRTSQNSYTNVVIHNNLKNAQIVQDPPWIHGTRIGYGYLQVITVNLLTVSSK